eukprot:gene9934-7804_t
MASTDSTPRVNFEVMQRMVGKRVMLVGEVEIAEPNRLTVKTSDQAKITVLTAPNAPYNTKFVEFIGTVVDPTTLQEEDHIDVPDNFDMNLYNELVKLSTGRYQDLFV